ncbi:MAG: Rv3235 family protein, partial [Mycobacteriales bacterium]
LEIVVGERPARQVAGWVSPRVLAGLEHRPAAQRTALGRRPMLRSIRVTEPADAVAEVSAVVMLGERVRAVAMRLEGLDGRWTVTALHVG